MGNVREMEEYTGKIVLGKSATNIELMKLILNL